MAYEKQLEDLRSRRARAKAMGSPKRLRERKEARVLNARQRVGLLCDAESFEEVGLLATSVRPEVREKTPADGVVSGFGTIGGRMVGVNAADFTTFGSSSAEIHGKKQGYVRGACQKNGLPLIYMQECAGGRIPDIMGATGIGKTQLGLLFADAGRAQEGTRGCLFYMTSRGDSQAIIKAVAAYQK